MTSKELALYLDSTILKDDATKEDITQLCLDAKKYGFKSVCINPYYVEYAKTLLKNTNVLVCTVIGFPLGMNTLETKVFETRNAISSGADEIDMVVNISNLKSLNLDECLREITAIKKECGSKILKVIVETSQLSLDQKIFASNLILQSDADFIKTSTGFIGSGANLEDIKLWKSILNNKKLIKAAGGIRDLQTCLNFINTGSDRIGTSNAKVILEELKNESNFKINR
ncbi:MAG: deoxyribose-phosphate aldolase [Ureaplasma sp.]|nr:deoxyribose-phosphate aldolase [Ureaplasma sp.]MDE7221911.1 deoxyribose-phosphate aldolase [Ureaplasma sp.]